MAGWMLLLALVLLGQCIKIVDGHNCCHPAPRKFLVPRGIKGARPTRLYGMTPEDRASACSPGKCDKGEPEQEPPPPPPSPPPPPPGSCPGPSVCEGSDTCGGLQDSKPNRPGLVDFETLLKDYAFYDEVDKRILTYRGDKKTVRFAPGTKKDISEPIYTHELKTVIDYDHPDDDCSDSFWGCLVGDLVAEVLSETSNETKELVEEVIDTLQAAQNIGHAVLDHLEGHPNKEESETTEDESFEAKRKRKKTNYPFLSPISEDTCPGCILTGKSDHTQSSAHVQEAETGHESQKVAAEQKSPESAGRGHGEEAVHKATPEHASPECAGRGHGCGHGEEAAHEATPEHASPDGAARGHAEEAVHKATPEHASSDGAARGHEEEAVHKATPEHASPDGAGCGDACGHAEAAVHEATPEHSSPHAAGCGDACGHGEEEAVQETTPEPAVEAGSDGGYCECDALVSKSCPPPAKRCLVSAERKSKDNYPYLEEQSPPPPVQNRRSCKGALGKAKEEFSKHAESVVSKVKDSPQFEKVQKAVFEKAGGAVSTVLTNLTKTAQMTEQVTKLVFDKANETMSKVFAVQINETGIPRQWVCEHLQIAQTSSRGEDASNQRHLETLVCLPEYLKYSFEGETGDVKPRELISDMKHINELLNWKMEDVEPVLDVRSSHIKTSQPDDFQNLNPSQLKESDKESVTVCANSTLCVTDRKEFSHSELETPSGVDNVKESLTQEDADSLSLNGLIKSDIAAEKSPIASKGDLETSSKSTATTVSSLENIPNERDVSRKSTEKNPRKIMNERFISVQGDIPIQNLMGKKKTRRSTIGLYSYNTERKMRKPNNRRFFFGKSRVAIKRIQAKAHETNKGEGSNTGRRKTFDWKYMKF